MPRSHVGLVALLTAFSLAPAAGAAPGVSVTTASGRVLHAGSVVARGRRSGDACVFGSDAAVSLRSRGAVATAVGLRTDGACRLVVSSIGATPLSSAPGSYQHMQKLDRSAPAGSITAGATETVADPGLGAALLAGAGRTRTALVMLTQTVYDDTGLRQYEDHTDASFVYNTRTGALSAMSLDDGYCEGPALDDVIADLVTLQTTEIRDCYYQVTYDTPSHAGFVAGGYYRQVLLGYERDARELTEKFDTYSDGWTGRICDPGSLPRNWSMLCDLQVVR
jgi:hypothetical protein